MTRSDRFPFVCALAAVAATVTTLPSLARAQHDDLADLVAQSKFFESQAWPIIEAECLDCHGPDGRPKGGFRIDAREGLLRGGISGPAFDEASPADSLILKLISWSDPDHRMPPKHKLADEDIAVLTEWILHGATWADGVGADLPADAFETEIPDGGDWWAWQPLERPEVPTVEDAVWVRTPIDAFVLAKLEEAGIEPAPTADRRTLIKRVAYDLTGLPPTPEAVEAFLADTRPDAYERMIDGYLDSPQHGVKWARHWLDAVRYADTDGYERDRVKPEAWRYRDWVVEAINEDKPWNRFLVEQLAGDELPDRDLSTLTATGFYRLGIWDDEPTDVELAKNDDLDSVIDVVSRGVMGMSIACARCHEHKKDPIAQGDYYRLAAIFRDLKPYKERMGNSIASGNVTRMVPTHFGTGESRYAERLAAYERERSEAIDELRAMVVAEADNLGPDPRDSGLVAHYPMDETENGLLADATGANPGFIKDARHSRIGHDGTNRALGFNGGDDRAIIPNSAPESFTISCWIRTDAQGAGPAEDPRWFRGSGIVDGEIPGIVDDFGVSMIGPGIIAAGVGRPETFVHSEAGYNDGRWHHIAFTRDMTDGVVRLFVDGREVASATGGTQPLTTPTELAIGRMLPGHGGFSGDIDEVRIHARPLPASEVASMATGLRLDDAVAEAIRETRGDATADAFIARRDAFAKMGPPEEDMTLVLCARSHGPVPPDTHILIRGDAHSPGRQVAPGVPQVLGAADIEPSPPPHGESSGLRLGFADWLVAPDNRVTWRVAANRLWQHLFGRGIVRSSDDFGSLGSRPTHPQLLDWLATEFPRRGTSRKAMARVVLMSSTYRMSSAYDDASWNADPLNDLMWRHDLRRLTAEELRDSILAVSGQLNPELGGKGVYPPMPRAVLETASRPDEAWGDATDAQAGRRSLYVFLKRSLRFPMLEGFDQPDTDRPCSVRFATTVPTQSLMLMNSEFTDGQAARFAARLQAERPDDRRAQIRRGLELVLCRPASDAEVAEVIDLIDDLREFDGLDESEAFEAACVLMLNLNEFLHVG